MEDNDKNLNKNPQEMPSEDNQLSQETSELSSEDRKLGRAPLSVSEEDIPFVLCKIFTLCPFFSFPLKIFPIQYFPR